MNQCRLNVNDSNIQIGGKPIFKNLNFNKMKKLFMYSVYVATSLLFGVLVIGVMVGDSLCVALSIVIATLLGVMWVINEVDQTIYK